jgi:hypothetical protein
MQHANMRELTVYSLQDLHASLIEPLVHKNADAATQSAENH